MMPTPQRQQGLDESAMALATLSRLSLLRDQAQHRALTESEQAELDEHEAPCVHCGGFHVRACPRVRRIVFRQGGAGVQEVEYWPASEIDWTGVIFEDVGDGEPGRVALYLDEIGDDLATILDGITGQKKLEAARRIGLVIEAARLESSQIEAVQSVHGQAAG